MTIIEKVLVRITTLMPIKELAEKAVEAFCEQGYTPESIDEKRCMFARIVEFHEMIGFPYYNSLIIAEFVKKINEQFDYGIIQRARYMALLKSVKYLEEMHLTGTMRFASRYVPALPDYYENILADILEYELWTEATRDYVWSVAKTFFKWLCNEGYNDLNSIDDDIIRRYTIDCASRMKGGINTVIRTLKKLCAYLHEIGLINSTHENILSFTVPVEQKIKPALSHDEIAATLDVIDRDTDVGKRDYAIILLAVVGGLRAVDISNLKLEDIDWSNGEIRITQRKTKKPLALPLTKDVGVAIKDYIFNARPHTELSTIFLRHKAPHRATEDGATIPYGQFNTHRQRVGMTKSPFHSLRRTLGNNLVISGIPVTMIAQILGHANIESTKPYLPLNIMQLKECALNFNGIEPDERNATSGGISK